MARSRHYIDIKPESLHCISLCGTPNPKDWTVHPDRITCKNCKKIFPKFNALRNKFFVASHRFEGWEVMEKMLTELRWKHRAIVIARTGAHGQTPLQLTLLAKAFNDCDIYFSVHTLGRYIREIQQVFGLDYSERIDEMRKRYSSPQIQRFIRLLRPHIGYISDTTTRKDQIMHQNKQHDTQHITPEVFLLTVQAGKYMAADQQMDLVQLVLAGNVNGIVELVDAYKQTIENLEELASALEGSDHE